VHVNYRTPSSPEELERVIELQRRVWGINDLDVVPIHTLRTSLHNGGVIIGAEHAGRCVGFVFGIPGKRDDRWLLWSYMMGVHPDYQGQGIGYNLKQEQRRWAIENGYDAIAWTFDPLRRRNAYFNLHKLGAYADRYHANFYGVLSDGPLLSSDRLEVTWDLDEGGRIQTPAELTHVFEVGSHGRYRMVHEPDWTQPGYAVDIPADLDALLHVAPQTVEDWQIRLREVLTTAFRHGYRITDFVSHSQQAYYVLLRYGKAV
jgi:predicted GNAT superfamily acetyltransferase